MRVSAKRSGARSNLTRDAALRSDRAAPLGAPEVAEDDADGCRQDERQQVDRRVEYERHLHHLRQHQRRAEREHDPDQPTDGGQRDGLDQKLQQHLAFERADGQPHADLARVEHVEVVVFAVGQLAALAQQLRQAGLDAVGIAAVAHRDQDGVDAGVAHHAALHRGSGQHDDVVLIVAHRALAFARQHADHAARELLDGDATAGGDRPVADREPVFGPREVSMPCRHRDAAVFPPCRLQVKRCKDERSTGTRLQRSF
jgi:hypothetical protein